MNPRRIAICSSCLLVLFAVFVGCSKGKKEPSNKALPQKTEVAWVTDAENAKVMAIENELKKQYQGKDSTELVKVKDLEAHISGYLKHFYLRKGRNKISNLNSTHKTCESPEITFERIPFLEGATFMRNFLTNHSEGTESILSEFLVPSRANLPLFFKAKAAVNDVQIPMLFALNAKNHIGPNGKISISEPFVLDFHNLRFKIKDSKEPAPGSSCTRGTSCGYDVGAGCGPSPDGCKPRRRNLTPLLFTDPPKFSSMFALPRLSS